MQIQIHGKAVRVSGSHQELAIDSRQFRDWVANLDPRFIVRSIEFQSVDFANHGVKHQIKFIKFMAEVVDVKGKPFSGIVFMRGGSVAILVILECEGVEYTILTLQPRFPSGYFAFPEIPAGTMEDGDDFVGGATRELEEETGIKIKRTDLVDITSLIYGNKFRGVFPTIGGSDEFLRIFALKISVSHEYIQNLQGKCTGLVAENEQITLKVIPLEDLPLETPDAKALSALMLYKTAKKFGKI